MNILKRYALLGLALLWAAGAWSSENGRDSNQGAYVTGLQGLVQQIGEDGKEWPLEALTRLPAGARLKISPGGQLQLVYLKGGRQEFWQGKAVLSVGPAASQAMTYQTAPRVKPLPAYLVQALTASPVFGPLSEAPRHAMVRVRSLGSGERSSQATLKYEALRADAEDQDILPELYLLSELEASRAYDAMPAVLDDILARQGGDIVIQEWVRQYRQRIPGLAER
ncbi:MAG: hypothetical protein AB1421_04380 [Pseudomonadota bacterium]